MNIFSFQSDLSKMKGIIDYQTSNTSFIKMSYLLKNLNIKNNTFFLYLSQPQLQGIDPHSSNLTNEQKSMIACEAKINPWYYFRELARIPVPGNINGVKFKLNRANLASLFSFFNGFDIAVIIPRQLGKTMTAIAITTYVQFIVGINIKILMFTKDDTLRVENVDRQRTNRDLLPDYLVCKGSKYGFDNTERITYDPLENSYTSIVAQTNPIAADKKTRGSSAPLIHIDEAAYSSMIDISYPVMVSSMADAIINARKSNQPNGIIITTTKGQLTETSGIFTERLLSKGYQFSEILYDLKDKNELVEVVKANSKNNMIVCEFSYRQLGKSDKWLSDLIEKLNIIDFDIVKRDYLNISTLGANKSPIPSKLIEKIKYSVKEPDYIQHVDFYEIRWYLSKTIIKGSGFKKIPIILGMDSSENVGNDFTALVFVDGRDGFTIGTCRCNETNITKMAKFISKILINNPNILFIPEKKSTGSAILDIILEEFEDYDIPPIGRVYNLYFQDNIDSSKFHEYRTKANVYGAERKKLGFVTTGSSSRGRNFLFKNVLLKALNTIGTGLRDNTLVNEIAGLVVKNGRVDHQINKHDDLMFAWILCQFVLFFGKNLEQYEFLRTTNYKLLQDLKVEVKDEKTQINDTFKQELYLLESKFQKCDVPILKRRLELKIQNLKRFLPEDLYLKVEEKDAIRSREKPIINYTTSSSNDFIC